MTSVIEGRSESGPAADRCLFSILAACINWRWTMSDGQSPSPDRQADDGRLIRISRDRRSSSAASIWQIDGSAATLQSAHALPATDCVPVPVPASAACVPLLRGGARARAALAAGRRRPRPAAARPGARIPPSPGARLPCSRTGCEGVMQYGGAPFSAAPALVDQGVASREGGWMCNARQQHSHAMHGPSARLRWEDDGGSGM
jgi:hypothetical protein